MAVHKKTHHIEKSVPLAILHTLNNSRSFAVFFATIYTVTALFTIWLFTITSEPGSLGGYLVYFIIMAALYVWCSVKLSNKQQPVRSRWAILAAILAIPSIPSILGIIINIGLWGNVIRINKYKTRGPDAFETDKEWLSKHKKISSDKSQVTTAIVGGLILSVIICGLIGLSYVSSSNTSGNGGAVYSTEDLASRTVAEFKTNTIFPYKVDEVTTLVDVTSTGNLIEYHYLLHNGDTSSLSNELLRDNTKPDVCLNTSTKSLLDAGVGLSYEYTVQETNDKYSFSVFSSDC